MTFKLRQPAKLTLIKMLYCHSTAAKSWSPNNETFAYIFTSSWHNFTN